jgi:ovo-like protein
LEIINGGHGIKNPMAADPLDPKALGGGGDKMAPVRSDGSDPSGKFACRMCGKGFGLQRLLNRHMKCHSDTKVLNKKY